MIQGTLRRAKTGFTCLVEGHAGLDKPGRDIVCAAATILARTAAEMLCKTPGIGVTPLGVREGYLCFEAALAGADGQVLLPEQEGLLARMWTAADFLQTGFESLGREFPERFVFRRAGEA